MSKLFIVYRDVKVSSIYLGEFVNPKWEDNLHRSKYFLEVSGPLGCYRFDYWGTPNGKELDQPNMVTALWSLVSDAECGENYDFAEFCSELGYNNDSINSKYIFESCCETAEKLKNISNKFDFGEDREFLDNATYVHSNNRVYSKEESLWCRPSEAIVLFDDVEYGATWQENRPHPGGPSTASMGDGWVDNEHHMPVDDAYWTWIYSEQQDTVISRYNVTSPDVQLIKPSSDDDDYYLTI